MPIDLAIAFVLGIGLGGIFFVALWLTVRRLPTSSAPALLALASYVARMVALAAGLYLIMQGDWKKLLAALAGILVARTFVIRSVNRELSAPKETRSMIQTDTIVFFQWGPVNLNLTIVSTWIVMALLTAGSWLVTRKLATGPQIPRWQNALEVIVDAIRNQIREVSRQDHELFLPFIGGLFLFIATSNILSVVPGFYPPTGSFSTTSALALSVFVAVPLYGITKGGLFRYLKNYIEPTVIMLPFNIVGELARTVALAVRLYGNVMSGTVVGGILLSLTPFFVPVVMQLFGLLTGVIQAYIFSILAMVYIASAAEAHEETIERHEEHLS